MSRKFRQWSSTTWGQQQSKDCSMQYTRCVLSVTLRGSGLQEENHTLAVVARGFKQVQFSTPAAAQRLCRLPLDASESKPPSSHSPRLSRGSLSSHSVWRAASDGLQLGFSQASQESSIRLSSDGPALGIPRPPHRA